jgi:SWI/SNF-related matrix-associated actin-dependent regulator 1 of chromatin subfamily A
MSAKRKNTFYKMQYFSKNSGNKKKWFPRNSYSISNDKNSNKYRKISFQLIDQDKVEVNPTFFMPPQIVTIINKNNGHYNVPSKAYQIPFSNYSKVYKEIDKLLHDEEYKKIIEFKNISLEPIPLLPLEVASKAKEISIIKFKSTTIKSNNKKSTVQISIDFTKDENKTIDSLPTGILSTLYQFQKDGISFGIQRKGRILLADEMGVGKSIQAIGISLLYKENWPVLVICPSSLKLVWRDEILKWIPDINKDKINIQVFKSGKDQFKNGEKFYIMSYDLAVKLEEKIINKNFNFIIADEAHYLKSPDAKRTKCLTPIIQKSKRVLLLTGTPILSRPVELYPLLTMLRPDLFHNFSVFGNRYCDPKKSFYGTDWTGSSCAKELNYILKNIMIRRLKKDVISQLPPKKRQKVEIQTDQKIIKRIAAINISSEAILEKINELNRSPFNAKIDYDDDNMDNGNETVLNLFSKVYLLSAEAKAQGVKDYIHYLLDNKCKFLVFAHHKIMLDAIEEEVKKLHIDYIRIDGKVKLEKRQEYVNKFQTDETCLVAILSITACYTGITLTAASTVIFSELHMTPAVMIQAEDRAHRIGQEHECVNIHYLYGPDTLDEVLFKMLNEKQNIFSNTLDNTSQNMEVKYTFKKVGDFEKGKSDLDVNINNKKIIVTNSGCKNMTLNNFVFNKKKEDNNNIELNNINLHRSQIRRNRELTPTKNEDDESNNEIITTEDINSIDIDIDAKDKCDIESDDESLDKNVFQKFQNDMNIDDNINRPTKDKYAKKKRSNKSNKNSGKVVLRTICDYFK